MYAPRNVYNAPVLHLFLSFFPRLPVLLLSSPSSSRLLLLLLLMMMCSACSSFVVVVVVDLIPRSWRDPNTQTVKRTLVLKERNKTCEDEHPCTFTTFLGQLKSRLRFGTPLINRSGAPIIKSVWCPFNKLVRCSFNKSVRCSYNKSVWCSFNQSVGCPCNKSVWGSFNKSVGCPGNKSELMEVGGHISPINFCLCLSVCLSLSLSLSASRLKTVQNLPCERNLQLSRKSVPFWKREGTFWGWG